jgi:hypothetical protein
MELKKNACIAENECLQRLQVQQQDLPSKLRMSEKIRLELETSLNEAEAMIKAIKIESSIQS